MIKGETYEEYKIRKGITNVHQASVVLAIDSMRIVSEKFTEAKRCREKIVKKSLRDGS